MTVRVCPAIVSVPLRGVVAVFASTLYATVPSSVPLLPPVTVIHPALLWAVHAHPGVVDTEAVAELPAATILCDIGDTVNVQTPICVTENVCPATVIEPVREFVLAFAEISK